MSRRLLLVVALCHHAAGFHIMPTHETVHLMQQSASHLMHQAPAIEFSHHLPAFMGKFLHQTPPPPPPNDLAHILKQLPQVFTAKFLHQTPPPPTPHDLAHIFKQLPHEILHKYTTALAENPLPTKMATGATLAMAGDAIAQSSTNEKYDVRRAASFGLFDMAYRALQHVAFPILVANLSGQYLGNVGLPSDLAAAMEQTLASQLGIVPFLYYPAFFALTGAVQGLDVEASVTRAKENFVPLMQRNLLFWIPVQFVQFSAIPEGLQIPFLSLCGLAWTIILSIHAGSAKSYASEEAIEEQLPTIELNAQPMYAMDSSVEQDEMDLEKMRMAESVVQ